MAITFSNIIIENFDAAEDHNIQVSVEINGVKHSAGVPYDFTGAGPDGLDKICIYSGAEIDWRDDLPDEMTEEEKEELIEAIEEAIRDYYDSSCYSTFAERIEYVAERIEACGLRVVDGEYVVDDGGEDLFTSNRRLVEDAVESLSDDELRKALGTPTITGVEVLSFDEDDDEAYLKITLSDDSSDTLWLKTSCENPAELYDLKFGDALAERLRIDEDDLLADAQIVAAVVAYVTPIYEKIDEDAA